MVSQTGLVLRSGHRGSKAYSLWDGVVPKPEHRLTSHGASMALHLTFHC